MNKIITEYLALPYLGKNNKYNYFYKIVCKYNNEYYYGIHVTEDLNDNYLGSGRLLNKRYKEIDINLFTKFILKFFDNTDEVYEYEKKFITHEIIKDKLCLNCIPGGRIFESNLNKKHIHYKDKSILVSENLLQEYLDNGWELGRIIDISGNKNPVYGKIWIHKETKNKYITKDLIDEFINNGWEIGMYKNIKPLPIKQIWMNKNKICKKVNINEKEKYLKEGWLEGKYKTGKYTFHITYKTKYIYKDNICKRINIELIDEYLKNGWKLGRLKYNYNIKSLENLKKNWNK